MTDAQQNPAPPLLTSPQSGQAPPRYDRPASPVPRQILILDRSDPDEPVWLLASVPMRDQIAARLPGLSGAGELADELHRVSDWLSEHHLGAAFTSTRMEVPLIWQLSFQALPPGTARGSAAAGHDGVESGGSRDQ